MIPSPTVFFPKMSQRQALLFSCTTRQMVRTISSSGRDPSCVDSSHSPPGWDAKWAVVYPGVLNQSQMDLLTTRIQTLTRRSRYQKGHWDSVIVNYKESTLFDEADEGMHSILEPLRQYIATNYIPTQPVQWLPPHAIDLHQDGDIHPHVDSVRFSGHLVCGLSLLSTTIMRLHPKQDCDAPNWDALPCVDLLLEPGSLYVLNGPGRYEFAHSIRPSGSSFRGRVIDRKQRFSVILRDDKPTKCE